MPDRHQRQQTEQPERHRKGGDSDKLLDLTGIVIQSVIALVITNDAQIAGVAFVGVDVVGRSSHARAAGATDQHSASTIGHSESSRLADSSILDSVEYRRQCG